MAEPGAFGESERRLRALVVGLDNLKEFWDQEAIRDQRVVDARLLLEASLRDVMRLTHPSPQPVSPER